jgi:hypothetical protein
MIHDVTKPTNLFTQGARDASLAGCGVVGKACKITVTYGTESNPMVAATFMAKVTRSTLHTQVPAPSRAYKSAFVPIPIKAATGAFVGMPKKSAPNIDG